VLSSREGGLPEILTHATELAGVLPGLNTAQIADMKLAGNKDGELYRLLLVAQCNALSSAMPFLFERIDDESELLLPGNLERTDSVVAKLVKSIAEEDWNEIEVIGWLYQFYISEKKDAVIGKVVKSEDIPAATQLFTPNWIVQYLVQNSVGRLWLMANPSSTLKSQWPYYIEPAEQTPEVQTQLDALIKTRMDEDGGSLNPETITVLDPACGSGHILVEAYAVLKGIYLERGYPARSIPRLVLEKNLYGLDIDDRAAQLAGFALLMKARADDRRLLDGPIKLNVLSLQASAGMDLDEFAGHLRPHGIDRTVLGSLLDTFTHSKTFGSLIQIPKVLEDGLAGLEGGIAMAIEKGDVFARAAAQDLMPLVRQAKILAMKFDAVVANPPYMGSKGMNLGLKEYAKATFPDSKSDLFAMFIERGFGWCKETGFNSLVTMQSWMFLSSYEAMREKLLTQRTIQTMAHLGARAFAEISGEVVQTTAFVLQEQHLSGFKPAFFRLVDDQESEKETALRTNQNRFDATVQDDFKKIPGSPVAYWVSEKVRNIFATEPSLGDVVEAKQGLGTGQDAKFFRYFWEVSQEKIGLGYSNSTDAWERNKKWLPLNKGGSFRKWYGNREYVIAFDRENRDLLKDLGNHLPSEHLYCKPFVSWSDITSANNSFRKFDSGFLFSNTGHCAFPKSAREESTLLSYCNNKFVNMMTKILNPTIHFHVGYFNLLPYPSRISDQEERIQHLTDDLVSIEKADWDSFETSWNFQSHPLLTTSSDPTPTLKSGHITWITQSCGTVEKLKRLEEENNRLFIEAYELQDELTSDVPVEQITLTVNPAYRYGGNLTGQEQLSRFRQDTMAELISYAIGCMMGRYSLDEPGLIYAHAGNVGFDTTRYKTFPADADGILPITDELWFEDDAAKRVREFLLAVWSAPTLDENMVWLAESLGTKGNETPDETLRRYLSSSFFKDHLQTYKKRPIYWLFSSGRQGAFQALVYLHRYQEGTLARLRAEYVVPLTGKMQSRIEMLEKDRDAATSTSARNRIARQIESLKKKHVELLAYDEKLRHYADMRISLDLDDGVKVNYGKFGDLLAEVKAVSGGASDD
jgi:type II restriction/modification system DNA methylase subunit YeeA